MRPVKKVKQKEWTAYILISPGGRYRLSAFKYDKIDPLKSRDLKIKNDKNKFRKINLFSKI